MRHPDAPNFFILGGAKCGTTTLYHLLRQVESVFLTQRKEPRFFGSTDAYRRGLAWYLDQHFRGARAFAARGEATPNYLHMRRIAAERIRAALGEDLKFIVLLRDPVRRAWSHYLHMRRLRVEDLPFEAALNAEGERLKRNREAWFGYFSDGLYAAQLEEWFAVFPPERYLTLLTDRLEREPRAVMRAVCDFLAVEEPERLELRVYTNAAAAPKSPLLARLLNRPNAATNLLKLAVPFSSRQKIRDRMNRWNRMRLGKQAPAMPAALERRLRSRYADDVRALEAMTGHDLRAWYPREDADARLDASR